MTQDFSRLVNLLWRECIQNLNRSLSEAEAVKFSNNDYYYLLVIQSLGEPRFSELAEALEVTRPAVTAIVRKLSSMELIEKVQSETDKRIFNIHLTDKGKSILEGDEAVYDWLSKRIQEILPDEAELKIVDKVITTLVNDLDNK